LEINQQGTPFREFYAALILTRMLSDRPIGYVDLRSPAGAGLGALVYNYDGSVFASDEGRMLAETGDNAFRLGHVDQDSYNSLILSDKLVNAISSSLTQCAPECSTCVYESHCGADPVYHHATQGDSLGIKTTIGVLRPAEGHHGPAARYLGKLSGRRNHSAAVGVPMTLPLYGTASRSAGFSDRARSVIRLRSVDSEAERHAADFALARTPDEVLRAMEADWPSIFVVSDGSIDFPAVFKGRRLAVAQKIQLSRRR